MILHSFRLKLGLLCVVLSGLLLSGFGLFALSVLTRVGMERIDRELRALADATIRKSTPPGHWARFDGSLHTIYGEAAAKQFVVKATLPEGQTLYETAPWPAALPREAMPLPLELGSESPRAEAESDQDRHPPRPLEGFGMSLRRPPPLTLQVRGPAYATVAGAGEKWRIMTMSNREVTLSLAMNLSGLSAEIHRFLNALLVAVPLGLLLIVGGGWLIGHLALRPVKLIAQTAESVTAARLDARIPESEADDEFKRLIALINSMLERLERSFRQATRFSADAAHELKTPLAILQAQIERSLLRADDDSPEQRDYAGQLEELQRLKTTLRKLLLLSQADAGQMPLSLARVNLADLVRSAENDIALLAPGRNTRVETPDELFLQADEDLLSQVVGNLVSNAVKFGAQDGTIELALSEHEGQAVLNVSNTGQPIPAADQAKVFDRFYRADSARSREVEGSGLGLSLAREMARAHGGELALLQSDAQRTTFTLRLPLNTL
jgi:heavy metal sensor kinase